MEQKKQDDVIRATPNAARTRSVQDETLNDLDSHILTASYSVNRPAIQESGAESLCEPRRKRISRSGETENLMINRISDKRGRKSDPPPKPARVIRTTRPPVTGASAQGTFTGSRRLSRDHVQGLREKENKKKIWSR